MKHIICILITACLISCASDDPYKKLNKLLGTWQADTGDGIVYEQWERNTVIEMHGKSYGIEGLDTTIYENAKINKQGKDVMFIAIVKDQNKEQPVHFKLISSDNSAFTFENKQHDFPQRVIYRFVNDDSIVARIEGDVKGELKSQEFFYSRVKK
jgi:flavodoxin